MGDTFGEERNPSFQCLLASTYQLLEGNCTEIPTEIFAFKLPEKD